MAQEEKRKNGRHLKSDSQPDEGAAETQQKEYLGTVETWGNQVEFVLVCLGYSVGE